MFKLSVIHKVRNNKLTLVKFNIKGSNMSSNQTRFGQIKRGQKFIYNGEVWIRTKGTFARREGGEVPFHHWPFSVEEIVVGIFPTAESKK